MWRSLSERSKEDRKKKDRCSYKGGAVSLTEGHIFFIMFSPGSNPIDVINKCLKIKKNKRSVYFKHEYPSKEGISGYVENFLIGSKSSNKFLFLIISSDFENWETPIFTSHIYCHINLLGYTYIRSVILMNTEICKPSFSMLTFALLEGLSRRQIFRYPGFYHWHATTSDEEEEVVLGSKLNN